MGAAACFKHDVAAYAFVACSVAAFASSRRAPLASVVRMAAGAAFVIVPVVAWLAWSAGRDAWVDLVAFPSGDFRAVRGESYPRYWPRLEPYSAWLADPTSLIAARAATSAFRNWTLAHAPEIAWIAIAIVFARARRELDPRRRYAIVLALAGIPIFWAAAHVQQNTHLFSMALLAALAAAASFGAQVGAAARGRRVAIALGLWYACGLWIAPAQDAYLAASVAPRSRWLDLPGARFVRVSRAEADAHRAIAEFVRANVPAGERIYCGVARHDAIVVGNQRWHMLAERAPAVRHGELHPGVTDREDVQRETIERLERHGVRCAVLWRFGWPDAVLDDIMRRRMERVPGTGATLLDRHLEQRFESVLEVGEYVVLWRKDAERPSR